jgi:hypothetical protein
MAVLKRKRTYIEEPVACHPLVASICTPTVRNLTQGQWQPFQINLYILDLNCPDPISPLNNLPTSQFWPDCVYIGARNSVQHG